MPLILPEKFRYAAFKAATPSGMFSRRGSNMEVVDTALKLYWAAVGRNNQVEQLKGLVAILKECNEWMKKKKDKISTDTKFKTRWDNIAELGREAHALALPLRNLIMGAGGAAAMSPAEASRAASQLAYEQNRARHLAAGPGAAAAVRPVTKKLDDHYAAERRMYMSAAKPTGGSRPNPISMTTFTGEVRSFVNNSNEDDPLYNANVNAKFGGMGRGNDKAVALLAKPLEQLTAGDMHALEKIVGEIAGLAGGLNTHVVFLDKSSRLPHIAIVKTGLLYHADGIEPWHGTGMPYAMDEYGNIFIVQEESGRGIASRDAHTRFNHSTFLSGRDVISAGTINVNAGKVMVITNNSGHYKPSGENLHHAVSEMLLQGVIFEGLAADPDGAKARAAAAVKRAADNAMAADAARRPAAPGAARPGAAAAPRPVGPLAATAIVHGADKLIELGIGRLQTLRGVIPADEPGWTAKGPAGF